MSKKTIQDIQEYVQRVAEKRGWKLHPNDDNTLDMLVQGLTDYYNRVGYFNCPCRDSEEDRTLDRDILCPCDYAKPDIDEHGRCYCALFFDTEYDFTQEIGMIQDKRPEPDYY